MINRRRGQLILASTTAGLLLTSGVALGPRPASASEWTTHTTSASPTATHWPHGAPAPWQYDGPAPTPVMPEVYELADLFEQMSGAPLEQAYMAEMIGHHTMAVMMAELEVAKGARPAVIALAERVIASQQEEIAQLTDWRQQWYGLTPEEALAAAPEDVRALVVAMETMMAQDMMALEEAPAGPDMDVMFLTHMIPHHQAAIIETRAALDGFDHRALARMGRQIIVTQSAEVTLMRHWLRVWGAGDDTAADEAAPTVGEVAGQTM